MKIHLNVYNRTILQFGLINKRKVELGKQIILSVAALFYS